MSIISLGERSTIQYDNQEGTELLRQTLQPAEEVVANVGGRIEERIDDDEEQKDREHSNSASCQEPSDPRHGTPLYTLEEDLKHLLPFFRVCIVCGDRHKDRIRLCTGCRGVYYCSRECQMKHWKEGGHKDACKHVQEALELEKEELEGIRTQLEGVQGAIPHLSVDSLMQAMILPSGYRQSPDIIRDRYLYLLSTLYNQYGPVRTGKTPPQQVSFLPICHAARLSAITVSIVLLRFFQIGNLKKEVVSNKSFYLISCLDWDKIKLPMTFLSGILIVPNKK